jgi:hypothetical protein
MTNGNLPNETALKNDPRYLAAGAAGEKPSADSEEVRKQRRIVFFAVLAVVVLAAVLIGFTIFLYADAGRAAVIRDIFIIFMALETLLIGFTLVILIVQIARLINLLQNEIKPILDSTNETVSTLRGTVAFLSDNLAGPVVKLNETFAAFNEIRRFFKSTRGK